MHRRDFLTTSASAVAVGLGLGSTGRTLGHDDTGPGYASPTEAMKAPREKLLYVIGLFGGTGIKQPDFLATVDVNPASVKYGQVIHRLPMPHLDDELHHFGWNTFSSCHGDAGRKRRFLIVPGFKSSRIQVIDVADSKQPKMHKVIEPEVVKQKTNFPRRTRCIAWPTVQ